MTTGYSQNISTPSPEFWPDDKLKFVDVGGAGGLQPHWAAHKDRIMPIIFEPNPEEAANLRRTLGETFQYGLVVETGLSHVQGQKSLNLTRYWGCTSLLRPNADLLSRYRIGPLFDIAGVVPVTCVRYDQLHREGRVPVPDAIKIDVQGYEYEVLQGFGGLLQSCIGIELETHLYPLYENQKLLHDVISLLEGYGFVLRRTHPVAGFDGDVIEMDVWFTKDIRAWRQFTPGQKSKYKLLCETWNLIDYHRINPDKPHTDIAPA